MPYLRKPSYLPLAGPSHFRSGLVTSGRIPPLPAGDVSYWFPAPGRPVTFQPNWNCHSILNLPYYYIGTNCSYLLLLLDYIILAKVSKSSINLNLKNDFTISYNNTFH